VPFACATLYVAAKRCTKNGAIVISAVWTARLQRSCSASPNAADGDSLISADFQYASANSGKAIAFRSMHSSTHARHQRARMADDVAGEAVGGGGGLQRLAAG